MKCLKTIFISALVSCGLFAQTTITDTLYNPSDTPPTSTVTGTLNIVSQVMAFNGTSTSVKNVLTQKIVAGAINFTLIPNDTTTTVGSFYRASYTLNGTNGVVTNYTETWVVPTSASPLTVSQVRVSVPSSSAVIRIVSSQVVLAPGTILVGSASGVAVPLAIGASGTCLVSNGVTAVWSTSCGSGSSGSLSWSSMTNSQWTSSLTNSQWTSSLTN